MIIIFGVLAATLFFMLICVVLVVYCSGTSSSKALRTAGNVVFGVTLMILLTALICIDWDSVKFIQVH